MVGWDQPGSASLWTAHSDNRDFRKAEWTSSALEGEREVTVKLRTPESGWQGNIVTVTFKGIREADPEFSLSTPLSIWPTEFPHE